MSVPTPILCHLQHTQQPTHYIHHAAAVRRTFATISHSLTHLSKPLSPLHHNQTPSLRISPSSYTPVVRHSASQSVTKVPYLSLRNSQKICTVRPPSPQKCSPTLFFFFFRYCIHTYSICIYIEKTSGLRVPHLTSPRKKKTFSGLLGNEI